MIVHFYSFLFYFFNCFSPLTVAKKRERNTRGLKAMCYIRYEIDSKLYPGKCLLPFCLPVYYLNNIKTKIYRTIIVFVVLCECETWLLTPRG